MRWSGWVTVAVVGLTALTACGTHAASPPDVASAPIVDSDACPNTAGKDIYTYNGYWASVGDTSSENKFDLGTVQVGKPQQFTAKYFLLSQHSQPIARIEITGLGAAQVRWASSSCGDSFGQQIWRPASNLEWMAVHVGVSYICWEITPTEPGVFLGAIAIIAHWCPSELVFSKSIEFVAK